MKWILSLALIATLSACGSGSEERPLEFLATPVDYSLNEDEEYRQLVSLVYNPGDVQFIANNLPTWASIDINSGVITGVPSTNSAAVTTSNITVTVTDGSHSIITPEFSISVNPINDAPAFKSSSMSLSGYQFEYEFELSYFDEETPLDQLSLSVFDSSPNFDVTMNPDKTIKLKVLDGNRVAMDGVFFDAIISDGVNTTSIIIEARIIETDEMSVTTVFFGDVYRNQSIEINFDQPINYPLMSLPITDECTGDVQVSLDGFTTCEVLKVALGSNSHKLLLNSTDLEINKNYKMKVSNEFTSSFGNVASEKNISDFYTVSGLMITEVGGQQHSDALHWFEVYNASRTAINLADYNVRTRAINSSTCNPACFVENSYVFNLNSLIVQPGQYAVVRGNSWHKHYNDGERVTYIGSDFYPYWDADGFIELVKESDSQTEDFVVFGRWVNNGGLPTPNTVNAWTGTSISIAPPYIDKGTSYTGSIVRNASLIDNNSSMDWGFSDFNTPGGPNDVNSSTDNDGDGLPDVSELEGATYAGLSLYDLGARVNQKDIFIEVDYMDSSDEGVIPREEALQKVVDAFALQNIAIHFDVGDLFDKTEGLNPIRFDLGGGNQVAFSAGVSFDTPANDIRSDVYDIKRSNMNYTRLPIFHYMLMAYSQNSDGREGSSGLGEINGNDMLITLGNWGLNSNDEPSTNTLINFQSSTIMHELGHNLGLQHGGSDDVNYKPNYLSVMNYLYSLYGLPTIGTNEGDRYYFTKNLIAGDYVCESAVMNNSFNADYTDFKIDYSSNDISLSEFSLSEANGLGHSSSSSVDYNCDGDHFDYLTRFDLNFSGNIQFLQGTSDWDMINLHFQNFYNGNAHGARLMTGSEGDDLELVNDVISNDIAAVMTETAPSKMFFEMLKSK